MSRRVVVATRILATGRWPMRRASRADLEVFAVDRYDPELINRTCEWLFDEPARTVTMGTPERSDWTSIDRVHIGADRRGRPVWRAEVHLPWTPPNLEPGGADDG